MLHLGRWQDAVADVAPDAVIVDPPYSVRCHAGDAARRLRDSARHRTMDYAHWGAADVAAFVASWAPRTRRWIVAMTSHDLIPAYEDAYASAGWYAFAPVPWVAPGRSPRLSGDGPASWTCYIMVARPRTTAAMRWRSTPGAYVIHQDRGGEQRYGGKPLSLMRALVRDYSDAGDLVCDPCAGYGTTLIAAAHLGRRAVGAEIDDAAWRVGCDRIAGAARQGSLL